ncbi:hypothetical protein MFLAVUS_004539 [Mucor flavus]|uniref:Uncharacterized protein n=1 Tax=Mucor flavus TaxID=439312 RepID=A0ABP9YW77_9FUNG
MKSPSDPDSKENVHYSIDDSFWIEVPNKMDAKEKAYALLLSLAVNKKPELLNRIFSTLYREFRASLDSKRPDISCARYSRLLCAISKSAKELERIRVDVLTITSTDNMVMEAMRMCCNVIAHDKKTPNNIKSMYEKMACTCNWKNTTENISLDTAISNVFNELIRLGEETDKATLGTFGLSADPTKNDKPGVQQLFELMIQVLAVDNTSLNSIQTTALKGAYMLSAHDICHLNKVRKCVNLREEVIPTSSEGSI